MVNNQHYIFIFTGEFGYELLNWQGKIRRFSNLHPEAKITCVSREATRILYRDFADFIPLDSFPPFTDGIADSYFLRINKFHRDGPQDVFTAWKRRRHIKKYIQNQVSCHSPNLRKIYVFSDLTTILDDMQFGSHRWAPRMNPLRKRNFQEIYDNLPFEENTYVGLDASAGVVQDVKRKLATMGVTSKFILMQSADRETFLKNRRIEPSLRQVFEFLSQGLPTVELNFKQLRNTDTQSQPYGAKLIFDCSSLEEQVALISLSEFCVFFSSGDFRSLHYVPAFCGKDVYSICSSAVVSNASIELWNREVFLFGGKILPVISETLKWDQAYLHSLLSYFLSRTK